MNASTKSDVYFIYTNQDPYCTIRNDIKFLDDNREERCGVLVSELDVAHVLPIARHISVLRDAPARVVLGSLMAPGTFWRFSVDLLGTLWRYHLSKDEVGT